MAETFANNASGNLNATMLIGATSCVLQAGQGAAFPATGNFRIVFQDTGEIALVGARSGDTLSSITRGIETTSAAQHNSGVQVIHEVTAGALGVFAQVPSPTEPTKYLRGDGTYTVLHASYGTTLPGSPLDGQEAILVDSTTLPTYQWLFRYNAGSSNTDKWEFIGGAPARSEVVTAETTTSATFVDLTTVGPSITLPRAGVYVAQFGADIINNGAGNYMKVGLKRGAAAISDPADIIATGSISASTTSVSVYRNLILSGMSASDVIKLQYTTNAGTATFRNRELLITPVRVS